jgi:hypothetical protein
VYHVFGYLKQNPKRTLAFDARFPIIDESRFTNYENWHEFYIGAEEKIPPDMPEPRGNPVGIYCFCDTDHASD